MAAPVYTPTKRGLKVSFPHMLASVSCHWLSCWLPPTWLRWVRILQPSSCTFPWMAIGVKHFLKILLDIRCFFFPFENHLFDWFAQLRLASFFLRIPLYFLILSMHAHFQYLHLFLIMSGFGPLLLCLVLNLALLIWSCSHFASFWLLSPDGKLLSCLHLDSSPCPLWVHWLFSWRCFYLFNVYVWEPGWVSGHCVHARASGGQKRASDLSPMTGDWNCWGALPGGSWELNPEPS